MYPDLCLEGFRSPGASILCILFCLPKPSYCISHRCRKRSRSGAKSEGEKVHKKILLCRSMFQVSGDLFSLRLFFPRLDRLGRRGAGAFTHVPSDSSGTLRKKYLTTSWLLFHSYSRNVVAMHRVVFASGVSKSGFECDFYFF